MQTNIKSVSLKNNIQNMSKKEKIFAVILMTALVGFVAMMIINPAFAAEEYVSTIQDIMTKMVNIVGTIFQAVGVILSIYAVGQLILAFKNEDANSKSTASSLLVVGIVLIALPGIIKGLDLVNMIGGSAG